MHFAFLVNEVFRMICDSVAESDRGRGDLAILARTCRSLEGISLDVLWGKRPINLVNALRALPPDSWTYTYTELSPYAWPSFVRFHCFHAFRVNTNTEKYFQSLIRAISPSELERFRYYTTRVTDLHLHFNTNINFETFQILIDRYESFDWLSLWPRVKTLCWRTPPEDLQFLEYFLTLGVRNLDIDLEGTDDEEFEEVLALVESRCTNLEDLRLFDTETREDRRSQDTIRQIIYNNSLTLRLFHPPQDLSVPLVKVILQLPVLRVLEMHIFEIPNRVPRDILPSLENLDLTLYESSDVIDLLGNLKESKLRRFALTCPYPTSKEDLATLAKFFDDSGLYGSVDSFSWEPHLGDAAPTWELVTTLGRFANMQVLDLDTPCSPTCHFGFRHEHVVELSRWMPRLKELCFGGSPCAFGGLTTDIGYHTFVALTRNCPNLSLLSIHFNIITFVTLDYVEPNRNVVYWDVGDTALPAEPLVHTIIALAASKLFPNATLVGVTLKDIVAWSMIREEFLMFTLPAVHLPLDLSI